MSRKNTKIMWSKFFSANSGRILWEMGKFGAICRCLIKTTLHMFDTFNMTAASMRICLKSET